MRCVQPGWVVVLAASLPVVSLAAEAPNHLAMTEHGIDRHVVPRFRTFEAAAGELAADLKSYCAAPTEKGRVRVTARFAAAVMAFAEIDFLRLGPLSQAGRRERLAFWPDPRGVVERQLRPLLARRDASLLAPGALGKQSAAVQGLTALEQVLTDTTESMGGPGEKAAYRCAFAVAIADNVKELARQAVAGWVEPGGWRERMLSPGPDNPTYKEPTESAAELVKALMTGMQQVQLQQLPPRPTQGQTQTARPFLGPYHRSGLTAAYMAAGIRSCSALYDSLGLASYIPRDKSWMKQWIANAFRILARDAAAGTDRTRAIRGHLNGIRQLVGREVSTAAGITLGFNELDGD